jgi:hypothetical protein
MATHLLQGSSFAFVDVEAKHRKSRVNEPTRKRLTQQANPNQPDNIVHDEDSM